MIEYELFRLDPSNHKDATDRLCALGKGGWLIDYVGLDPNVHARLLIIMHRLIPSTPKKVMPPKVKFAKPEEKAAKSKEKSKE